jgi:hypothetical protein
LNIAQCSCGSLRAEVSGPPDGGVVICHCAECQRRTGAPFGVGAYYSNSNVLIKGESRLYTRVGASGHPVHQHFCPSCGTTLYWYLGFRPDVVGIAVGGFVDPIFPAPIRSVWEQSRHEWVKLPDGIQHFPQSRSSGQVK